VFLPDAEALGAQFPLMRRFGVVAAEYKAWAALPLRHRDRIVGGMGLSFARPQAFDTPARRRLQALAGTVADVLEATGQPLLYLPTINELMKESERLLVKRLALVEQIERADENIGEDIGEDGKDEGRLARREAQEQLDRLTATLQARLALLDALVRDGRN
jgi:hypothetical protein